MLHGYATRRTTAAEKERSVRVQAKDQDGGARTAIWESRAQTEAWRLKCLLVAIISWKKRQFRAGLGFVIIEWSWAYTFGNAAHIASLTAPRLQSEDNVLPHVISRQIDL
jgi:hypothetical protein